MYFIFVNLVVSKNIVALSWYRYWILAMKMWNRCGGIEVGNITDVDNEDSAEVEIDVGSDVGIEVLYLLTINFNLVNTCQ
jgi:hypothetical protein